ncbi:MAG: hypothetical protein OXT05_13390 [Chloroflexota bacterium]|nr:hypothetical protein [Chloroflexota bacterium]
MAENDPVLEQRVEALEQFSQTRVVEQVGDLTKRVTSLETARETESPFLATKEDIARLEGLHAATQKQIAAQSELFNTRLDAQSELFNARLDTQSEQFNARLDTQSEQFNARLDTQSEQFNKNLQAQSEQFNARLDAQSEQFSKDLNAQSELFDTRLDAQSEQLRKEWQDHMKQLAAWLVRTGIAISGVIIAAAAIIINRLPS